MTCACAKVRQVARLVIQLYEDELHEHLPVQQFGLLSVILHRPGCNQAILARELDFDKSTLSRNLKLLEKNGWIRHVESDDLRERGYHLTPSGAKIQSAAKPGWERAQKRLRNAMTDKQWDAMWQTLGDVTDAAREALKQGG